MLFWIFWGVLLSVWGWFSLNCDIVLAVVVVQHLCVSDAPFVTHGVVQWQDWHDLQESGNCLGAKSAKVRCLLQLEIVTSECYVYFWIHFAFGRLWMHLDWMGNFFPDASGVYGNYILVTISIYYTKFLSI